jgi:hypothetical protein
MPPMPPTPLLLDGVLMLVKAGVFTRADADEGIVLPPK